MGSIKSVKKEDLLNDPDFKSLVSQKNTISWILTVLELVLYFGFIALIAFNKPFNVLCQFTNGAGRLTLARGSRISRKGQYARMARLDGCLPPHSGLMRPAPSPLLLGRTTQP